MRLRPTSARAHESTTRRTAGGASAHLSERVERGGRRRRTYELTPRGRAALDEWLAEPETRYGEFRLPAMLKIFFGADPGAFAADQTAHHERLAEQFEGVRAAADRGDVDVSDPRRRVLDTGIALHLWWAARWREIGERPFVE